MVIVDSCVWIDSFRRSGALATKCAIQALLEEYEATVCVPVRLEVLGGARKEERVTLERYFSALPYLRAQGEDWNAARDYAWHLSDQGVRVPWFDLVIASIALRTKCRVYSFDKHFALLEEHLGVRLYRPGYGGMFAPDA